MLRFRSIIEATSRDLRKFGLVVGSVLVVLGLFFLGREIPAGWGFLIVGVLLVLLGAIIPATLKWPYVAWMALALALGTIVSTVLLVLIFYLIVTPIGLVARLAGKDFLRRRLDVRASSCWLRRDPKRVKTRHHHERQF